MWGPITTVNVALEPEVPGQIAQVPPPLLATLSFTVAMWVT